MRSTISLFRKLYNSIPPLFPPAVRSRMHHALSHLAEDPGITVGEIEQTMICFGYEVWPWNQAYREFLAEAEGRVGEHFFVPKLSNRTARKYEDFKHYGGSFRDLHSGRAAQFFSTEERVEIAQALVDIQADLRNFTDHEIIGSAKTKFLNRVEAFKAVIIEIKKTLNNLRQIADKEYDHPVLADEIRSRIISFEYGLCYLGPKPDEKAVQESVDYFHGRKQELNRLSAVLVVK